MAGGLSPYLPKFAYLQVGKMLFWVVRNRGNLFEVTKHRDESFLLSGWSIPGFWRMEIRTARDLADTYVNAGWLLS